MNDVAAPLEEITPGRGASPGPAALRLLTVEVPTRSSGSRLLEINPWFPRASSIARNSPSLAMVGANHRPRARDVLRATIARGFRAQRPWSLLSRSPQGFCARKGAGRIGGEGG